MSQIPLGFDKVTDHSDKLICIKVLMDDNGLNQDQILQCLAATICPVSLPPCFALFWSMSSAFSLRAMHWQFLLRISNTSIKDQLKMTATNATYILRQ